MIRNCRPGRQDWSDQKAKCSQKQFRLSALAQPRASPLREAETSWASRSRAPSLHPSGSVGAGQTCRVPHQTCPVPKQGKLLALQISPGIWEPRDKAEEILGAHPFSWGHIPSTAPRHGSPSLLQELGVASTGSPPFPQTSALGKTIHGCFSFLLSCSLPPALSNYFNGYFQARSELPS